MRFSFLKELSGQYTALVHYNEVRHIHALAWDMRRRGIVTFPSVTVCKVLMSSSLDSLSGVCSMYPIDCLTKAWTTCNIWTVRKRKIYLCFVILQKLELYRIENHNDLDLRAVILLWTNGIRFEFVFDCARRELRYFKVQSTADRNNKGAQLLAHSRLCQNLPEMLPLLRLR